MGLDFGTYFYLKKYTILIGWMNTTGQMRSLIEHNHVISGTPLEHGIEALEHIFVSIQQLVARVEFSSDDTNIPEIIDENQNQNLTKQEQDESRIKSEDVIGTAAFEIS
ncbi:unnamed protein product [Rhizophagus irregularis]|nr:unnamed protein product [Rhizophagus irregularis]